MKRLLGAKLPDRGVEGATCETSKCRDSVYHANSVITSVSQAKTNKGPGVRRLGLNRIQQKQRG